MKADILVKFLGVYGIVKGMETNREVYRNFPRIPDAITNKMNYDLGADADVRVVQIIFSSDRGPDTIHKNIPWKGGHPISYIFDGDGTLLWRSYKEYKISGDNPDNYYD